MARSSRQAKIIEIINKNEIDTQEELVTALKKSGFNVTQATISRDIKELGLFKVSGEQKKYKYAIVENENLGYVNKINNLFKDVVISAQAIMNQVVIKTIKGSAGIVAEVVDRLAMTNVLGCVFGVDTVLVITESEISAKLVLARINEILV